MLKFKKVRRNSDRSHRPNQSCLFLDLDGTLWDDNRPYGPFRFFLPRESRNFLKEAKKYFDLLIVVTNQTLGAKKSINIRIYKIYLALKFRLLLLSASDLDSIYVCCHHPDAKLLAYSASCNCRKPKSGLIQEALIDWNICAVNSSLLGDRISDVFSVANTGVKDTFLLTNPRMFELNVIDDNSFERNSPFFRFVKSNIQILDKLQKKNDSNPISIFYLAAGLGTRLLPLTRTQPKPLVEFKGEAILKRLINQFNFVFPGANHLVNISHLPEKFVDLATSLGKDIDLKFTFEREPMGSAKSLRFVSESLDFKEDLIVVHSDLVLSGSYVEEFKRIVRDSSHSVMIGHLREANVARSAIVVDEEGFILEFSDSPKFYNSEILVNSGIYLFKAKDLASLELEVFEGVLKDSVLRQLIEQKRIKCKLISQARFSIESMEILEEALSSNL